MQQLSTYLVEYFFFSFFTAMYARLCTYQVISQLLSGAAASASIMIFVFFLYKNNNNNDGRCALSEDWLETWIRCRIVHGNFGWRLHIKLPKFLTIKKGKHFKFKYFC